MALIHIVLDELHAIESKLIALLPSNHHDAARGIVFQAVTNVIHHADKEGVLSSDAPVAAAALVLSDPVPNKGTSDDQPTDPAYAQEIPAVEPAVAAPPTAGSVAPTDLPPAPVHEDTGPASPIV